MGCDFQWQVESQGIELASSPVASVDARSPPRSHSPPAGNISLSPITVGAPRRVNVDVDGQLLKKAMIFEMLFCAIEKCHPA